MDTQRVNAYKNDVMTVFYVEQYNPELKQWFTVGDTFEKVEHATASVERHNLSELVNQLY